jgi:hypothetical protein
VKTFADTELFPPLNLTIRSGPAHADECYTQVEFIEEGEVWVSTEMTCEEQKFDLPLTSYHPNVHHYHDVSSEDAWLDSEAHFQATTGIEPYSSGLLPIRKAGPH